MSIEDLYTLRRLLKKFIDSDGDLPDERTKKTLSFVTETLADSDPDYNSNKDF